jgi:hypothetical protein
MRYMMTGGSELVMPPGVQAGLMQRQVDGGNLDGRGLGLSVFGSGWGCCPPLFDQCTDDPIMMLFHGLDAVEPGLRWIGLRKAQHIKEKRAYLSYVAPAGAAAGEPADGLPLTVCGPGVRVEMGRPCYIECCGFGEIRLMSNELKNGGTNTAYCKERDVYTVDFGQGSRLVSNDEEWWLAVMGGQLLEILGQRAVAGDSANVFTNTMVPNDSDGLYKYLTKSYPECPQLNPFVLDWGSNPACDYTSPAGMAGVTLNALPVTSPKYAMNLYVTLRAVFRETMKRIRGTRMLGNRTPQPGDLAILLPDWAIECLIECAICHVICRDDYTRRDSEMAAMKYDEWLTGWNGLPYIVFDRMIVPLIAFNPLDWRSYDPNNPTAGVRGLLENADGSFNLFMLWRGIGGNNGRRFLELQYNDLSDGTFDTANNGAIQLWDDECGRCYILNMALEWRWCGDAPFLQTLVSNIHCDRLFGTYNVGPLMPATADC